MLIHSRLAIISTGCGRSAHKVLRRDLDDAGRSSAGTRDAGASAPESCKYRGKYPIIWA
jgi:hypothetical protein